MIGTAAGMIKVVDVKKNKVILKLELCKSQIFDCDWGEYGIVVASEDGFL